MARSMPGPNIEPSGRRGGGVQEPLPLLANYPLALEIVPGLGSHEPVAVHQLLARGGVEPHQHLVVCRAIERRVVSPKRRHEHATEGPGAALAPLLAGERVSVIQNRAWLGARGEVRVQPWPEAPHDPVLADAPRVRGHPRPDRNAGAASSAAQQIGVLRLGEVLELVEAEVLILLALVVKLVLLVLEATKEELRA